MGGSIKKVLCCMGLAIGASTDVINVLLATLSCRIKPDEDTVVELARLADEYAIKVRALVGKI